VSRVPSYLLFGAGHSELQVCGELLTVLQLLPRQLPLLLQTALQLAQLPLRLQQLSVQLQPPGESTAHRAA